MKKPVDDFMPEDAVKAAKQAFPNVGGDWRKRLLLTEKGRARKNLANTMLVLSSHDDWRGVLAYDDFAETVVKLKAAPVRDVDKPVHNGPGEWTDADSTRTAAWIQSECDVDTSAEMVTQAVIALAECQRFHPVRQYLESLTWDREERLDSMLVTYFGAESTPYTKAVSAKFMIAAVARVMCPGAKVDTMLVLESEKQGLLKSSGVKVLGGEWFADTGVALGEKDSFQALRGVWIYEFGEMASFKGRDAERIKSFLSSSTDHYRPSYGRRARDFPRQTVCVGTTNQTTYLVDRSGNRRFWPVRCSRVDLAALTRDRDQLWAEALVRFRAGERWYLSTATEVLDAEVEQADRETPDDWVPIVGAWLESPTVPHPESTPREVVRCPLALSEGITTADVLLGAIGMRPGDIRVVDSMRAGEVLRELGWAPGKNPIRRGGKRVRLYRPVAGNEANDTPASESTPRENGCAGEGVRHAPAENQPDYTQTHPTHPHSTRTHSDDDDRRSGSLEVPLCPGVHVPEATAPEAPNGTADEPGEAVWSVDI